MVSAGELGDELRRIAADLPLGKLAEAVVYLESAQQTLLRALNGSTQPEAREILGWLQQVVQAARETQQFTAVIQGRIEAFAGTVGRGGRPDSGGSRAATPARRERPKPARSWKTVAEELSRVVSYPSFRAAKRALGSRPGYELHHITEQSQALPMRSGFDVSRNQQYR